MASDTFGTCIYRFLTSLEFNIELPSGFELLNPYTNDEALRVVAAFCNKFYNDCTQRIPIWGINPGRFGGGVTGLSFTDPFAVANQLGISTTLGGRRELSAEFIGIVIEEFGGPEKFYSLFYLSALSPLGFVKNGKNVNFYDDRVLAASIVGFISQAIVTQGRCGLSSDRCVVLGTGALKRFVEANIQPAIGYREIQYLEHPRFIMQYRRPKMKEYVSRYLDVLARFA
ncbi:MAG: DUF4918 family protein [Ignavibacteria bacterium]|nr:DUF4918 family protein [Ignavibacteria bacterium]